MGCCKSGNLSLEGCEMCFCDKHLENEEKIEYSTEELELQKWENKPGLQDFNSRQIIDALLQNCNQKVITEGDLENTLISLNYKNPINENFQRYKENSGYSYIKLAFSGILLGSGSNEDKLYCLFSLLDQEGSQFITKSDMAQSIKTLVSLAICEDFHENSYTKQLSSMKTQAIARLTSEICCFNKITQSELRDLINNLRHWDVFNSKTLRSWVSILPQESSQDVQTVSSHRAQGLWRVPNTEESTGMPFLLVQKQITSSIDNSQSFDALPNNIHEEILSSSSDSSGPVCLKANISPKDFYVNEDLIKKPQEFVENYELSPIYKQKL
ncbi:hypothetical protein SteCoe_4380 [Stentor coeruleus]|uniref:EF-hand domain-containing protein n=1 Tax=Stentor coeruleus TaxID=5963 RepID=A0A1R2CUS3_9CILI|nr:hypothetical protein SteCoe_4380 [Stentor coeruleus]